MGAAAAPRGAHPFLSAEVLELLIPLSSVQRFSKETVIFRRSSRGQSMYIIEDGEVQLFFDVAAEKRLGKGELFGEIALITGDNLRTATAVAATDASLRVIDQGVFDQLLEAAPKMSVELLRSTCTYLLESEQRLVADLRKRNQELEQTLDYLRRTKEELDISQVLMLTDELTGLYNRRFLNRQGLPLLRREDEAGLGLALLLIDIDRLKQINDTLGHSVGDLVIKHFAGILKKNLRQTDLPCRIGGDEFAVLLCGAKPNEAEETAKRLLAIATDQRFTVAGAGIRLSCSIGGSEYRRGEDWESLFQRADSNLYLAKQNGRNRLGWGNRIAMVGKEIPT
jgi:diguanylate cyclase (GGDEF)-like protein